MRSAARDGPATVKLELIAANSANASVSKAPGDMLYQPLKAVATGPDFSDIVDHFNQQSIGPYSDKTSDNLRLNHLGVQSVRVVAEEVPPRKIQEPNHPHADKQGFVEYPNINPIDATTRLMEATRMYEANVKAFNASKSMAETALSIGK